MFKHRIVFMLALFCLLPTQPVHAFFDAPWITPENPIAGEAVSVNIRGGVCDDIDNVQAVTRDGNAIRILFFGVRYFDSELCNIPIGQAAFPIGAYPPGSYTLQVDLMYGSVGGNLVTDTLGIVPFTVGGAPAVPAPAPVNAPAALLLMLLAMALLATWKLRARGSMWLLIGVISLSPSVRAQDVPDHPVIQLLLTTAPGAPTPDELVSYYNRSPRDGALPLQALSIGNPQDVQYLLPVRASGDFLVWLQANPESSRAILERFVVVLYPPGVDTTRALAALRADPYVAAAYVPLLLPPTSVSLTDFSVDGDGKPLAGGQYGRNGLNIDAAWQIAGGWALIAAIDFGLYEKHPALRQFSDTGVYLGGNFIPVASLDVGRTLLPQPGPDYASVDEARPLDTANPNCANPVPITLGHGTHTAGLIAANGASGQGVQGTCKHCGIAEWKISYTECAPLTHQVRLRWNSLAQPRALTNAVDTGAQIVSMSFGGPYPEDYCYTQLHPPILNPDPLCLAMQYASDRAVAMVASSGNDRSDLNFPASEPNVISAGGFQENLALWDESPGSTTHCPVGSTFTLGKECGSNFTALRPHAQQEVVASARAVLSTTYPQFNYNVDVHCGDGYPGPGWGNGVGLCTGTSMSAPQIAGVVGILRSINPLARVGLPTDPPSIPSVRGSLASTTFDAQAGYGWTARFGYGRPDAAAAARKMLGGTAGTRNRVTPLFRLYSESALDYADVTSPQYALALMINQKRAWRPVTTLPTMPSYPSFPHGPSETLPGIPRASVYVMTTEVAPRNDGRALLPLYLMDKAYPSGPDFMLVTSKAEIEQASANGTGYNLRNIQGYIYAPCVHEPSCIPPGAQKFWRKYNVANNDCATFLESERTGTNGFEARGYTAACPAGPTTMLGYVYASISPCADGTSTLPCHSDSIFKNGFEVL